MKRIDEIMMLVPKRIRKPSTKAKTGDIELDEKISDLNRRLYYLKKYGLEIVPPKRDYHKKCLDFYKTKTENECVTLFFD